MKVLINGYQFKVKFVDGDTRKMKPDKDHYNLGLTEYVDGVIRIRKGMDRRITRSTVIHELTHAFMFSFGYTMVLVYKCGQEKLNNLYYQVKKQRRCSTWRKTRNLTLRNSSSRS